MPDTAIKDQIKRLVELQKTDQETFVLKIRLQEKPKIIQQYEEEFDAKKAHLNELESQVKEIQVRNKELELDLQSMEADIAKGNSQLYQLKTNKEYSAKIAEIEGIKADKSALEEKMIKLMDEIDQLNAAIKEEKDRLSSDEEEFLNKKKEIEAEMDELKGKIAEDEQLRKDLLPDIDPNLLRRYDQVLNNKQGLAIAPVVSNSCGGCHMNLTPQTVNRIRMYSDIIQCEMCMRILYLEDDL